VAVAPKPDLVAEDPKPAGPATAHCASGDDAPLLTAQIGDRGLLDDVGRLWNFDLERGVVELASRPPPGACRDSLV
jgi:hypothetical protein